MLLATTSFDGRSRCPASHSAAESCAVSPTASKFGCGVSQLASQLSNKRKHMPESPPGCRSPHSKAKARQQSVQTPISRKPETQNQTLPRLGLAETFRGRDVHLHCPAYGNHKIADCWSWAKTKHLTFCTEDSHVRHVKKRRAKLSPRACATWFCGELLLGLAACSLSF